MGALQTVKKLKDANQDFEWYPTTREIIEAMYWDLLGKKCGEETYRAEARRYSMLDIGAGNCKVFNTIKEIAEEQPLLNEYCKRLDGSKNFRNENERLANRVIINKCMAIEKSSVLVDMMPREILVVGTEFHENTLIDKQSDIVFCNPPYSEYAEWSTKIIREANTETIYLVIPQRWGKHRGMAQAIKDRKAKVKIIGNFDFLNAEDRKARAYVSLVKIELNHKKYKGKRYARRDSGVNVDPFDLWFHDTFKIKAEKEDRNAFFNKQDSKKEKFSEKIERELVSGRDLISVLVQLYNQELEKLITNYQKLSEIDADLFKELNIDIDSVLEAFKLKITGLKNFYWEEIFNNLSEITKRLTRSTRNLLKNKLMTNANIDFTKGNVRSVVIWVLKNANHYYEQQMLDLYDTFTTEEGIKFYKSNQHFTKDDFRYNTRDELEKYALDYRIVLHSYIDDWDKREGRIGDKQYENIRDVSIIGRNLGFSVENSGILYGSRYNNTLTYGQKENIFFSEPSQIFPKGTKTLSGKIQEVYMHTNKPNENGERVMEIDGVLHVYSVDNKKDWIQYKINDEYIHSNGVFTEESIFTTVRPYKNGNCHFQFNKRFIQKLNLEVGRIRGWLKNPAHAAQEMDITVEEATEYWNSNFILLPSHLENLLPQKAREEHEPRIKDKKEKVEILNLYDDKQMDVFKTGLLFNISQGGNDAGN